MGIATCTIVVGYIDLLDTTGGDVGPTGGRDDQRLAGNRLGAGFDTKIVDGGNDNVGREAVRGAGIERDSGRRVLGISRWQVGRDRDRQFLGASADGGDVQRRGQVGGTGRILGVRRGAIRDRDDCAIVIGDVERVAQVAAAGQGYPIRWRVKVLQFQARVLCRLYPAIVRQCHSNRFEVVALSAGQCVGVAHGETDLLRGKAVVHAATGRCYTGDGANVRYIHGNRSDQVKVIGLQLDRYRRRRALQIGTGGGLELHRADGGSESVLQGIEPDSSLTRTGLTPALQNCAETLV